MATAVQLEKDFQTVTNEYAARVIGSMKDDLDALHHAQDCKRKGCKRGSETRKYKCNDGTTVEQNIHEYPEAWHDEDAARDVIQEGPLSVEVRSDWYCPGGDLPTSDAVEYKVLLGTGGPAFQVIGELDSGQPQTARFEYQDWFKPWTVAQTTTEQDKIMLEWVRELYFGD